MPIVIETSALVALYKNEAEADRIWLILRGGEDLLLPASCYLEITMVLRTEPSSRRWLDKLIERYEVAILGSDPRQARLAADAFERFGRGSSHPARLNFGDCLAYAAARALDAPLLFKGEDFAQTDARSALAAEA